jgi:phosphotransferase system enzyme I (PtsI)
MIWELETMRRLTGLVIQSGIAYGKIHKWIPSENGVTRFDLFINQKELLINALKTSTEAIENAIKNSSEIFNETFSMIFEAHKLMVNDPILLNEAYRRIEDGENAYDAYKRAALDIINQFQLLSNDYMRNRIIDIKDATDRVLYTIQNLEYENSLIFDEPHILLLPEMRPSIILNCDKRYVSGFIVETGNYDQHASLMARRKEIPGMIIEGALNFINEGDVTLIDANNGVVYINPSTRIMNQYHFQGAETDEL